MTAMAQNIIRALALVTVAALWGCGRDFAGDPFGDAGERCGGPQSAWKPGCATARNIAAQAENPADLATPRVEGPRDAMRRDALLSGYVRSSAGSEPPRASPAQPLAAAAGGRKDP
jgi:hypothetical protein